MVQKRVLIGILIAIAIFTFGSVHAASPEAAGGLGDLKSLGAAVGAGLAMGLAAIGAGYGVGNAGAAALGAIAEKPEMATWGLIFVALAEGLAIFGFAIAFLLMGNM